MPHKLTSFCRLGSLVLAIRHPTGVRGSDRAGESPHTRSGAGAVGVPKPGYPGEWYTANESRVIAWMDAEGLSHLCMINYMDTNRMIATRLSRLEGASDSELEEAREQLEGEMVERLRRFNAWACELGAREPRIIPFVSVDVGVLYDETTMMERSRRAWPRGRAV